MRGGPVLRCRFFFFLLMATATGGPLNTAKRQLSAFLCLTRGMTELPSLLLARQHTNALLPLLKAQLDKLSGR